VVAVFTGRTSQQTCGVHNGTRAVNRGCEPMSGQTKDHKIGICCFSAKHAALRKKNKDWLARNQNNGFDFNH